MRIGAIRIASLGLVAVSVLFSSNHVGAQVTVRYTKIQIASRLSAKIVDGNGDPVSDAVVEETDSNWKDSLRTTKTDATGTFSFPLVKGRKTYYVRITKYAFCPLEFPIKVSSTHRKTLTLEMKVAD